MIERFVVGLAAVVLLPGCVGEPGSAALPLPFVDEPKPPAAAPVLSMQSDDVVIDVYDVGECAVIVEFVPEYGYLVDEFCPGTPSSDPLGARFGSPACPVTGFGDECQRWLPRFVVGKTIRDAAYVCMAAGRVDVANGWWLAVAGGGQEAFPLNADGVRLDSVSNEFDDTLRRRCEASDPELTSSLIDIRPDGYELPVTVELDMGVSGSFLLVSGFEPFVFETQLPTAGAPMLVMVFEGADGSSIGQVAVPEAPECEGPVFVLDLSGPTGEWSCRG